MQVHEYNYSKDYWRTFDSCKPNEEWTHAALPSYSERKKKNFLYETVNSG